MLSLHNYATLILTNNQLYITTIYDA